MSERLPAAIFGAGGGYRSKRLAKTQITRVTSDELWANKNAQGKKWIPKKSKYIFSTKNGGVDDTPDTPREPVHRSSPLASHGLVAPPGSHGFQLQRRGWGRGRWPAKKRKHCHTRSGPTLCVITFGGWGARVSYLHCFTIGASRIWKPTCISNGDPIVFQKQGMPVEQNNFILCGHCAVQREGNHRTCPLGNNASIWGR